MRGMELLLVVFLSAVGQQPPASSISFETLRATVAPAAAATSADLQQVTVDWTAFVASGELVSAAVAIPINTFQLLERRIVPGPLPLDRNPELSADQLVVVGVNQGGAPLTWQLIRDPRVVRSEQPGPDGILTGEVLYRGDAQLTLVLPDAPELTQVRLYQPRWTGARWTLDLIASFAIGTQR